MTSGPKVILAGGNGYIGGTTAFAFMEAGFQPVILDNFSTSRRGSLQSFPVFEVDLNNLKATSDCFEKIGPISAIIHFAAKALVPESFQSPESYFRNNLNCSFTLAELAHKHGVPVFVHSSSCAVYGVPHLNPIPETAPLKANSPYGDTKILVELFLNRYCQLRNIKLLNLRYFNPAGAWAKHAWGESHEPETHLVPNIVRSALTGKPVSVYGDTYPTPDGSCIRDFIHVVDLAQAHVKAVEAMSSGIELPICLNVGRGKGSSVLEVIETARRITGKNIEVLVKPPREGDPPELVADPSQMNLKLGWKPERGLEEMIQDDWTWRVSSIK